MYDTFSNCASLSRRPAAYFLLNTLLLIACKPPDVRRLERFATVLIAKKLLPWDYELCLGVSSRLPTKPSCDTVELTNKKMAIAYSRIWPFTGLVSSHLLRNTNKTTNKPW